MASFNPENYAPVDDRIAEFYRDHPAGSVRTFLRHHDEKQVIFEAQVYRSLEEAEKGIYTSGFAREVEGAGSVNRTSHVENCETSAIGRALANLGYSGHIDGQRAPRPSQEEMQKTENSAPTRTVDLRSGGSDEPWTRVMPIGKSKGKALGDLDADTLRSTIAWCTEKDPEKFATLIEDARATLTHMEEHGDG